MCGSAPTLAAGSNARMRQRHMTAAEGHRRRARARRPTRGARGPHLRRGGDALLAAERRSRLGRREAEVSELRVRGAERRAKEVLVVPQKRDHLRFGFAQRRDRIPGAGVRRGQDGESVGQGLEGLDEARRRVRGVPERERSVREVLLRAGHEGLHAHQGRRPALCRRDGGHDCSFSFLEGARSPSWRTVRRGMPRMASAIFCLPQRNPPASNRDSVRSEQKSSRGKSNCPPRERARGRSALARQPSDPPRDAGGARTFSSAPGTYARAMDLSDRATDPFAWAADLYA